MVKPILISKKIILIIRGELKKKENAKTNI